MKSYSTRKKIIELDLLAKEEWRLASIDLEITARCNLSCRHCYICQPPAGPETGRELSTQAILSFARDAVRRGALTCLFTGGEPLLRKDFIKLYEDIKKLGLIVTIFSNGTLLTKEHIAVFKDLPPRHVELTVYGSTDKIYDSITRIPGSYRAFRRGLALLKENNIPFRLKTIALRSNLHEQEAIRSFCLEHSRDHFRFDPFLHLRFDHDDEKNRFIKEERLTPKEIVKLEQADDKRYSCLENSKETLILPDCDRPSDNRLFRCGAGLNKAILGYDGTLRLCESLFVPGFTYDLQRGSLDDFLDRFVPEVRTRASDRTEFLTRCRTCPIINLCIWCPAHAYLETGKIDQPVDYFCRIAHARRCLIETPQE